MPEDGILHIHRRENLKSYILFFSSTLIILSRLNPNILLNKNKEKNISPLANYTYQATGADGEVSVDFWRSRMLRGQRKGFLRPLISVS
jgi:hypothetical protein